MAERRMFARTIIASDAFLDMPSSARLLYYDLGMRADDDGFVNSPRRIMRETGASEDDLNILLAKRFLIRFDSGVMVIKHWRVNNYLQNDRHKDTEYQEELAQLYVKKNRAYSLKDGSGDVYSLYTQNSLDKNRKDYKGADSQSFPQSFPQSDVENLTSQAMEVILQGKYCMNCGTQMTWDGSEPVCPQCGSIEWEVRR